MKLHRFVNVNFRPTAQLRQKLFTLAVIVGAFGFVYWFHDTGSSADRVTYRVLFDGSVSGLRTGASVLFNGLRVGEVAKLQLDAKEPSRVIAMARVSCASAEIEP